MLATGAAWSWRLLIIAASIYLVARVLDILSIVVVPCIVALLLTGGKIAAESSGGLVLMLFVMFFLIKDGSGSGPGCSATLRFPFSSGR